MLSSDMDMEVNRFPNADDGTLSDRFDSAITGLNLNLNLGGAIVTMPHGS